MSEVMEHVLLPESHVPMVEQSPPVGSSDIVYAKASANTNPLVTTSSKSKKNNFNMNFTY